MKAYKYLLIGALMLGSSVPTFAQNDNKAVIEQGTKVILAKGADYKDQVKQLYKENKKNPEVLVAFGKVFLAQKDTANAKAFANYALARNPKYAKAFLLKGDIAVSMDDAGGAAENYQQAKYFDPKDPEGYYKYAMILRGRSPEDAVSNLEDLRKQRPDYPVDALAGRIYYFSSATLRIFASSVLIILLTLWLAVSIISLPCLITSRRLSLTSTKYRTLLPWRMKTLLVMQ